MVVAVFDAPVVADGLACELCIDGFVGQVKAGFACGFPLSGRGVEGKNSTLDADDGGDQAAPVGAGDDVAGVEDGDGSGFVAVAAIRIFGLALAERGSRSDAGTDLSAQ